MRRRKRNFTRRVEKPQFRTNREIRVPEIRLVGENIEQGVYDTQTALRMADELELDLVEISPNAVPPVCKIIDYKKFLYERKKREKEIKSNTQKTTVKEIRFTPNTDEHDFDFKAKHAQKFLEEGAKVRAYVHFRGRMIMFKERGELILLKLAEKLTDYGGMEQMPKLEGRRMSITLTPKKK